MVQRVVEISRHNLGFGQQRCKSNPHSLDTVLTDARLQRQWKDIKHKYMTKPEEDEDEE